MISRFNATDSNIYINLTYDYEDKLTLVNFSDGSYIEYSYDSSGNRVKRTRSDGSITIYHYALGELIYEHEE